MTGYVTQQIMSARNAAETAVRESVDGLCWRAVLSQVVPWPQNPFALIADTYRQEQIRNARKQQKVLWRWMLFYGISFLILVWAVLISLVLKQLWLITALLLFMVVTYVQMLRTDTKMCYLRVRVRQLQVRTPAPFI